MFEEFFDKFDSSHKEIKRLQANVKEVMKLYGISEAEEHIIMQMAMLIRMMGLSPKLTLKCLQALTTTMEIIHDQMKRDGQLKDE